MYFGGLDKSSFTHSDCNCESDPDVPIVIVNMGFKAIFAIAIAMTCDIAMWIVQQKCYEPKFVIAIATSRSQSQSLCVNEP